MTVHALILRSHNSARSVRAEGMLNHWAGKLGRDVHAHSAGSAPSGRINTLALEVLDQVGTSISAYRSKGCDGFSSIGASPHSRRRGSTPAAAESNTMTTATLPLTPAKTLPMRVFER